jgi:hypothetical protein
LKYQRLILHLLPLFHWNTNKKTNCSVTTAPGATRVFSFVISNLFRYVNSSWAKAVHHQLLLVIHITCPAIFTLTGGLILAEGITIHFSFPLLKIINSCCFLYTGFQYLRFNYSTFHIININLLSTKDILFISHQ